MQGFMFIVALFVMVGTTVGTTEGPTALRTAIQDSLKKVDVDTAKNMLRSAWNGVHVTTTNVSPDPSTTSSSTSVVVEHVQMVTKSEDVALSSSATSVVPLISSTSSLEEHVQMVKMITKSEDIPPLSSTTSVGGQLVTNSNLMTLWTVTKFMQQRHHRTCTGKLQIMIVLVVSSLAPITLVVTR